jgi:hypothetical protein
MNMAASDKILRFQELRARFAVVASPSVSQEGFKTGCAAIDETVGGLYRGAINESSGASGSNSLLLELLLRRALEDGTHLALVDAADAFDPQQFGGALLSRMLWVRCQNAKNAVRSTDLLLRDGNLPLVILDLQLASTRALRGIPGSVWHRLGRLLESSGTTLLVFSARPLAENVRLRITTENAWQLDALQEPRKNLISSLRMVTRSRGALDQRRTA